MAILDERTKSNFLIYANSVIKSRAIPFAEDNLKPVHRRILWSMYEDKIFSDKKTVKCAKIYGNVMGKYHPHGDAALYGALVHLSQTWKLRYPLIDFQGSNGNLLGDPYAAGRYTECRLSPIGMLMLEDIDKNAVEMRKNYDETLDEPVTLPSRFPYLLCGNNSGIAVGMSSDIVSHNYTEVAAGIKYYLKNPECTVADLMQYIKGPDFPTKGKIINGENLLQIYTTGQGSIKVQAHYEVVKNGNKTQLIFHDIPYGTEITSGVLSPLKKLVTEDGFEVFEDYYTECTDTKQQYYDIVITLNKNANVAECLNILFSRTKLSDTIKINQTVIINGEPKILNLKEMIAYWVNYRSGIIKRIAQNDYDKTNHKLTVTIGLQKCMSDIDQLVSLIRYSDSKADAKAKIMKAFDLNDEQADAVLDMKLSRLSRLDVAELDDTKKSLEETLAKLKDIVDNQTTRYDMIAADLDAMKKIIGKDDRLTEICYNQPVEELNAPIVKKEYLVYADRVLGVEEMIGGLADGDLKTSVFSYSKSNIIVYSDQEMSRAEKDWIAPVGAFVYDEKKPKVVSVTKDGYVKVSAASEYKWGKREKVMKIKDGDALVYVGMVDDSDYLILWNGEHILKLKVDSLPLASKLTIGVKSGFESVVAAFSGSDSGLMLCVTSDNKGKFTAIKDFSVDNRGNKGQALPENTTIVRYFDPARDNLYIKPKIGKLFVLPANKLSIKGRMASGATISTRALENIL